MHRGEKYHSIWRVSKEVYWSWSVKCEVTGMVPWRGPKQLSFKRNFCMNIGDWPSPPATTVDPPVSQGAIQDPSSPCQSRSHSCPVGTSPAGNICSCSCLCNGHAETCLELCAQALPTLSSPSCSPFTGVWPALQSKSSLGLFLLVLSHYTLQRQFLFTHLIPSILGFASPRTWTDKNRNRRQSWWREQQPCSEESSMP